MRLLKQIMEKKMDLSSEFMLNRNYKRGIWQFYCVYNIALVVLGKQEDKKEIKIRNRTWKRFLLREVDEKSYRRMQSLMQKDLAVIIDALKLIQEESEKMGYDMGDIYKIGVGYIGCLSMEYPE